MHNRLEPRLAFLSATLSCSYEQSSEFHTCTLNILRAQWSSWSHYDHLLLTELIFYQRKATSIGTAVMTYTMRLLVLMVGCVHTTGYVVVGWAGRVIDGAWGDGKGESIGSHTHTRYTACPTPSLSYTSYIASIGPKESHRPSMALHRSKGKIFSITPQGPPDCLLTIACRVCVHDLVT